MIRRRGECGTGVPAGVAGIAVLLAAGCTSLLGADGEYRDLGDGVGGAPGTSTSGSGGGATTSAAAGGASSTTNAQSSTISTGGGGGGGEGPTGLPACTVRPRMDKLPGTSAYALTPSVSGVLSQPRMRYGPQGITVTATEDSNGLLVIGGTTYSTPYLVDSLAPMDVGTYRAAGVHQGLLEIYDTQAVLASLKGLVGLIDSKPVSPQAVRFLVENATGKIEDRLWLVGQPFDNQEARVFPCEPVAITFVEVEAGAEGGDNSVYVCEDGAMGLVYGMGQTQAGDVRHIAAAATGDSIHVVVTRADGVFLHRFAILNNTWEDPVQLDVGSTLLADHRPAISVDLSGDVVVAWTRQLEGKRLAGALCGEPACCDLGLDAALESLPDHTAVERWAPALARGSDPRLALAFAGRPTIDGSAIFGVVIEGFEPAP